MHFKQWFEVRGVQFVAQRGASLLSRYGMAPERSVNRIERCTQAVIAEGGALTFFLPGVIVDRYPRFVVRFAAMGAETAVHGYNHVDLSTYAPGDAAGQLFRGLQALNRLGIHARGFRCPYLGFTEELLNTLPAGLFDYSSNRTICLDVVPAKQMERATRTFETLSHFYRPTAAGAAVSAPTKRPNLVEIPVCTPDDLQLFDGLKLGPGGVYDAWEGMLNRTHDRGELFTLIFHPELSELSTEPLLELIKDSKVRRPPVWHARLCDIAAWWREREQFCAELHEQDGTRLIAFKCSDRATILVKGLAGAEHWDGKYCRLHGRLLVVPADVRPLVGLAAGTDSSVVAFLQEQGYIVDTGASAQDCSVYLSPDLLATLTSQVALVDHIECSPGPLVRFGRWPDGARSAMCATGDLDALTLLDYLSRPFVR